MKKSNKIFLPSAICHLRHIIFTGFLLSSLVAASTTLTGIYGCAGLSTNGVTSDGGGSDETEESGGAVEFPSTIDIPAGTTTPGTEDPNALPQISLPAPNLQSDRVVAFASDATSTVALDASSGTVDTVTYPTTEYVVGVSKDSTVVTNYVSRNTMYAAIPMWLRDVIPLSSKTGSMLFATKNKNGSQDDKNDGFPLISKAHAQDTTTICDATGLTCCPINSDGSFTCYIPETTNSDTIYIYLTNSDGSSISAPYTETPNTNLLWFAKAPSDLKVMNDTLYSITDSTIMVQTEIVDSAWTVTGDYNTSYEQYGVSGTKMDMDPDCGTDGIVAVTDGSSVSVYDVSTGTNEGTYSEPVSVLRTLNNSIYFGVQEDTDTASIEVLYDYTSSSYVLSACDPHDSRSDAIPFISTGDLDNRGNQLTHRETLWFDSNSNGWFFVLYKDQDDIYRVRLANKTLGRFGGTAPFRLSSTATHDFKQIGIFNDDSSTGKMRALVLDTAQNAVWVIRGDTTASSLVQRISTSNMVAVGAAPVAMAFNSTDPTSRSRAYVLNQTDESISVISLSDSTALPTLVTTLSLSDYAPGKTLTFTPSTLVYKDGYLLIGAEGIKGAVVVDVTAY